MQNNSLNASPLNVSSTPIFSPSPTVFKSEFETFMEDNKIKLTAKKVQFDMENNLNVKFALEGYAEIDDYYNYGYDDYEKDYFCICVEPSDGSYSDSWYVYCHRESFNELFDYLLEHDYKYVMIIAKIDEYQSNQNNMATAYLISW
jgi:hypothetical protein